MKMYKLHQGSPFENLKHFIYLTNEYGVPSSEFIDGFILNFGEDILNGLFRFNIKDLEYLKKWCKKLELSFDSLYGNLNNAQIAKKELDELWEEIEEECKNNKVKYSVNHGYLFYEILETKAVDIIKDTTGIEKWNQLNKEDQLDLLKQFIIDFDKYIM